ncbi:hypothetical protein PACID_01010 [Acidipropionibacterium acidipropionici ATCC 4875]|uniref:Uncharacterized protein n=1 Tax=Acidipropionibacterium acidipropionici (strain ATCC 4875 / DSM 20272 / JCM 6432 / NBRC 12425 / NCIMB 8070 / 4) TaxID=1171373 RepID=K7S084_ACIA4|nr:hypothetical protein [Acidipropionibacterium acidipropionici]AFV87952.1 hypothetical protein PACID_01010 [Acidipropionibacterium acidipropionici ATCC 4875]
MTRTPRTLRSFHLTIFSAMSALLVPLVILVLMITVSVIIALIIGINTGLPLRDDVSMGMTYNMGAVFSIPGFLISYGALTVNRQFATAMAFGSTRRNFWIGSSLGFLVISLVTGVGSVLLMWLEKATGHWFIGARAMDVYTLGSGRAWQTLLTVTVLCLCSLYIGAGFGTVFRAWGAKVATAVAIGAGLVIAGAVALIVWQWDAWGPTLLEMGAWTLTVGTGIVGLIAMAASFIVNRRSGVTA